VRRSLGKSERRATDRERALSTPVLDAVQRVQGGDEVTGEFDRDRAIGCPGCGHGDLLLRNDEAEPFPSLAAEVSPRSRRQPSLLAPVDVIRLELVRPDGVVNLARGCPEASLLFAGPLQDPVRRRSSEK
jgi:hypothetical protein